MFRRHVEIHWIWAMGLCAISAFGQSLDFEVASVKPVIGDAFSVRPKISPGRFQWTSQVAYMAGYAYDMDVSKARHSSPVWGEIYAIEAVFDPSASGAQVRKMLRTLLAERFNMQARVVGEEASGYALKVASKGFKLRPVVDDLAAPHDVVVRSPELGIGIVKGRRASIRELAANLQRVLRVPVWDQSGQADIYDFEFNYRLDDTADSLAPWIGTALEEALGLRLEKQTGIAQTLVIDRLDPPSEN